MELKYLHIFLVFSLQIFVALNLPAPSSGILSITPVAHLVVVGENAMFRCSVTTANLEAIHAVAWERVDSNNTDYIIQPSSHYQLSTTDTESTLTIINISTDDIGGYYCVAYMMDGDEYSNHSLLQVFEQISVTVTPSIVEAIVRQNVTLPTLITGTPNVTTVQKRNEQTGVFEDVSLGKYSVLNNTVTLYFLLVVDTGEYRTCVSNLPRNRACGSFSLTVTGFPIISLAPIITINNGSNFSIICHVTQSVSVTNDFSDLHISWQGIDGQPVLGQITRLTDTKSQLFIERVTDPGHYMCIATNAIGTSAMVTRVNVETCIPEPPLMVKLSCRNNNIAASWVAAERDSSSPLTAYYIEVNDIDSDNTTSVRVGPTETNVEIGRCVKSTVLLRAENDCGSSNDIVSTIYVEHINQTTASPSSNDDNATTLVFINIIIAVIFLTVTLILLTVIFYSWWKIKKLRNELKTEND